MGPTRFTYQWQRCRAYDSGCVAISGATQSSYVATSEDVDFSVVDVVTVWNAAGSPSATSVGRENDRKRVQPWSVSLRPTPGQESEVGREREPAPTTRVTLRLGADSL
jgi:hypothetical protein